MSVWLVWYRRGYNLVPRLIGIYSSTEERDKAIEGLEKEDIFYSQNDVDVINNQDVKNVIEKLKSIGL